MEYLKCALETSNLDILRVILDFPNQFRLTDDMVRDQLANVLTNQGPEYLTVLARLLQAYPHLVRGTDLGFQMAFAAVFKRDVALLELILSYNPKGSRVHVITGEEVTLLEKVIVYERFLGPDREIRRMVRTWTSGQKSRKEESSK